MPIKNKGLGFTLIELLISMVLGVVVIGSLITFFATTVRYNSDNLQMIRLNQELRGVMSLISRDLRRAGYFNSASTTTTYLDVFGGAGDCIHFAYDINANGTVEDSDYVAFKLEDNEIVVGQQEPTESINCTDDTTVDWLESITKYDADNNRSDIKITQLQFVPECSIAGGAVIMGNFASCNSGTGIEVRNVMVTITGEVTTPVDNTTVTRTLTETIKLRNDSGV